MFSGILHFNGLAEGKDNALKQKASAAIEFITSRELFTGTDTKKKIKIVGSTTDQSAIDRYLEIYMTKEKYKYNVWKKNCEHVANYIPLGEPQ
eukprot:gene441-526_t